MNSGELKVLMVSSDRQILVPDSAVSLRIKEYGALVSELHIVLLSDRSHGLKDAALASNVWVYPTNSSNKFLRPFDASRIGKKIVFDKKFVRGRGLITTQDPFECGWAGLKIKHKWRLPLEVQLHTDPFSPYFSGLLNILRKHIAKKVVRKADTLRVVSNSLKEKMSTYTKTPISVLPIFVEREKIENAPIVFDLHSRYPWRFILLTVSRLAAEKDIKTAIRALALVRQKFPETGLLIVGSGPEEGSLKVEVKKLGLLGAVEFAGWQTDLASFYKTANVFLQTSRFEGYGLSLVEAGLSGLPVVTTNVGLAQELENNKDAYIFPINSPALIAGGIVDLLENNQKRENLKFNLKNTLRNKLITKEQFLQTIQENWEKCSTLIR